MQDKLRKEVKQLKAFNDITYKEISEYLEIQKNSFYNWLRGYYDLSDEKTDRLKEIICNLKE